MKPIFCIDATENKNNTFQNGSEFTTATVAEIKTAELEEKEDEIQRWRIKQNFLCGCA